MKAGTVALPYGRAGYHTLVMKYPRRLTTSACLFSLALVVRLAYLFVVRPPFETEYWGLATSLLRDGSLSLDGFKVTDFEPVYPAFLAALRFLTRDRALIVQMAQGTVAAFGAMYLYRLTAALTGRRQPAAIAAVLYAFDPLLIRQATQPADSALVATLLVAFAYYFVTARSTARMARAGIVLGLAVLTRSMTLLLLPFAVAVLISRRHYRSALTLATVVFALVLPLVIRNWLVNESLLPTRSGLNLYIGNSPYSAALLPDYDLDILEDQASALIEREASHLPPPTYNRVVDTLLTRYALNFMAEHPLITLRQKALNILYLFSPRLVPFYITGSDTRAIDRSGHVVVENPHRRPFTEVVSYAAFYTPVLLTALIGIYLRRRSLSRDAILWCIVANFVAIHALYYPATRYRAPMEFVLLFYAAVAVQYWLAVTPPAIRPTYDR